ncbi:MAG TPA: sialidase family protein [Acidimicrobiales bacterium]|nr:sialidase family protein [Acidimicrobiales bacterium]
MSSAPTLARTGLRLTAILGVGALVLASCGTTLVKAQRLNGTPALSISVPLSNIGCTLNDVCVAVGTSSASVGPTSVGEFATPSGRWLAVALPVTSQPSITSAACSGTQCLLAGSVSGRDLLWRFDAASHSVSIANPPPGGNGVSALTCNDLNCALIDSSAPTSSPRFSFSADGGVTWSNPLAMTWANGDVITSTSCGQVFNCAVSAVSASHQLEVFITRDDGATWVQRSTPNSWTTLTSLSCVGLDCVGLATIGGASALVRSSTFARTWTHVSLPQHANALSCVAMTLCVVVGQNSKALAWLATVRGTTTVTSPLRYVPTPLLGVACGSKVCAAIGVTTVLSLPLALKSGT